MQNQLQTPSPLAIVDILAILPWTLIQSNLFHPIRDSNVNSTIHHPFIHPPIHPTQPSASLDIKEMEVLYPYL